MSGVSVVGQPQGRQTLRDFVGQQPARGPGGDGPGDGGPGDGGPGNGGPGAGERPAGGSPGHERLRHSAGPWVRAAGGADALHTHLAPVRSELEKSHAGLLAGTGTGVFAVLGELAAVRESWVRRVSAAQGECGSLAGKLRAVAREQGATEQSVRSSFDAIEGAPADGGRGR